MGFGVPGFRVKGFKGFYIGSGFRVFRTGCLGLRVRAKGFRVCCFIYIGFRVLGFQIFGLRVLGFGVLGIRLFG